MSAAAASRDVTLFHAHDLVNISFASKDLYLKRFIAAIISLSY